MPRHLIRPLVGGRNAQGARNHEKRNTGLVTRRQRCTGSDEFNSIFCYRSVCSSSDVLGLYNATVMDKSALNTNVHV